MIPSVRGILETALYVKDVPRAAAFYRRLFGFGVLVESDRLIALNVADRSVLLLFKEGATADASETSGGTIPGHAGAGPTHFAFAIDAKDVESWKQRLAAEGVAVESEVTWPGEARSVYFRDLDGNLAELITPGFWRLAIASA